MGDGMGEIVWYVPWYGSCRGLAGRWLGSGLSTVRLVDDIELLDGRVRPPGVIST